MRWRDPMHCWKSPPTMAPPTSQPRGRFYLQFRSLDSRHNHLFICRLAYVLVSDSLLQPFPFPYRRRTLDPEFGFDASIRNIRKGEALFLLAFNYAELAKQFGGLPLIVKPVALTDEMNVPRSTFDETISFITDLCDQAATLLPEIHPDSDYGRVTKGAALSLKARMLLYAASPLWNNPSKPTDSPFRGKYDPEKWKKAAQAAQSVIDMNLYALHPDISTLFLTRTNPELIFVRMNQPCSYITGISVPSKLYPPGDMGKADVTRSPTI